MVTRIVHNATGQSVSHIPSERIASAAVVLEDLSRGLTHSDRVLFSGAATVATSSWGVTAAVSPTGSQPFRLQVASTADASSGLKCYLVDPSGAQELATIDSVGSTYIDLSQPVLQGYASGTLLYPAELSVAFPDASASLDRYVEENTPLQAVFSYTGSSGIVYQREQVRVVRSTHSDFNPGPALDLFRIVYPDLPPKLDNHARARQLNDWALAAYSMVRRDLNKFTNAGDILLGDQGLWMIVGKIAWIFAANGLSPGNLLPSEFMESVEKKYSNDLANIKVGYPGQETVDVPARSNEALANVSKTLRNPWVRM